MIRTSLFLSMLLVIASCGSSNEGSSSTRGPVDRPDQLGGFAVGHVLLEDEQRGDRPLPIDVWYPVDPEDAEGATPATYVLAGVLSLGSEVALAGVPVSTGAQRGLLVFSHGYQGIGTQSIGLMEILASHGFIVAAPEHTGNAQGSETDSFDEAAANRVPDVSFVIDRMLARSLDPNDPFSGRIDEERIGVLGHSFGGMTSIGSAAGWADAEPDPRVNAILPVSAVIVAELQSDTRTSPNAGFTREQLEGIRIPVMFMGGTEDTNVFLENNEIAFEQVVNAPRRYRVDIIGATHTHFANVCQIGDFLLELGFTEDAWASLGAEELPELYELTCGPEAFSIEEANRLANLYTVAFFRRHLLDDAGYEQFLTASFADTEEAITFFRN